MHDRPERAEKVYMLAISDSDWQRLDLSAEDRAMLDGISRDGTIADKLLALTMVVGRLQETNARRQLRR